MSYFLENRKISEETFEKLLASQKAHEEAPKHVLPAPCLFEDLRMLEALFKEDKPALFPIRYQKIADIICGFADASGGGLGSMMQEKNEDVFNVRLGVWSTSQ